MRQSTFYAIGFHTLSTLRTTADHRERFEREAALVADRNLQASDIVRLNIGGKERVSLARSTLTLYEDSMLGAMFSGRHKVR